MGKLRNKLIRFMYGRNGMDNLNMFLFVLYFVLVIILWIVGLFAHPAVSLIGYLLTLFLAIYMTFRCMSRNICKRQAENRNYLTFSRKRKDFFMLQKNKFKDRKTHIYKKCPYCSAVLRLKRIKGDHRAACPRCSNSFDVKVR